MTVHRRYKFRDNLRAIPQLSAITDAENDLAGAWNNLKAIDMLVTITSRGVEFRGDPSHRRTQFHAAPGPTTAGVPSVRVARGYVSIGGVGRYSMADASTALDNESKYQVYPITGSGWLMVRITKATPSNSASRAIVLDGTGPNPASTTYYERAICRVVRDGATVRIYDANPGEMTWETSVLF